MESKENASERHYVFLNPNETKRKRNDRSFISFMSKNFVANDIYIFSRRGSSEFLFDACSHNGIGRRAAKILKSVYVRLV